MTRLVLQGPNLTSEAASEIAAKLQGSVKSDTNYAVIELSQITDSDMQALRNTNEFDINVVPAGFESKAAKLLVTDMDSTLINIECVDEIADFINVKPQVAEITEAAMRGEIDFETSLRQRVSLLKGLEVSALERVYLERLQLNPGAEVMLKRLQQQGIKTALVSGGFTFFTERLKQRLGLDFTMANVLGEHNGRLTGEVVGDICGAQAKADFLLAHCEMLGISPAQVVAMGDGANDLLMMNEAGLSVAYHAKPTVQEQASTALNYCGLEGVLGLLQLQYN
ncbi:MAG: phosphoserine phosphatase SerB [Gammaproteobacteria bacterium]|nr:MAG: phosphoserine phosphatase SerB [Gammaproteobacteria bacterium]